MWRGSEHTQTAELRWTGMPTMASTHFSNMLLNKGAMVLLLSSLTKELLQVVAALVRNRRGHLLPTMATIRCCESSSTNFPSRKSFDIFSSPIKSTGDGPFCMRWFDANHLDKVGTRTLITTHHYSSSLKIAAGAGVVSVSANTLRGLSTSRTRTGKRLYTMRLSNQARR